LRHVPSGPLDRRRRPLATRPARLARRGRPRSDQDLGRRPPCARRQEGLVSRLLHRAAPLGSQGPQQLGDEVDRHEGGGQAGADAGQPRPRADGRRRPCRPPLGRLDGGRVPLVQGRPVARTEPVVRPVDGWQPARRDPREPRRDQLQRYPCRIRPDLVLPGPGGRLLAGKEDPPGSDCGPRGDDPVTSVDPMHRAERTVVPSPAVPPDDGATVRSVASSGSRWWSTTARVGWIPSANVPSWSGRGRTVPPSPSYMTTTSPGSTASSRGAFPTAPRPRTSPR